MMIFDGLHIYETVLLVLGALLFLVLLFVLVYLVLKKRAVKGVVPLFLVSIVMMGFPGIQKIRFDNGVLEIDKLAKQVDANPNDKAARDELKNKLTAIETRPVASPRATLAIAKAQTAVGEKEKARANLESVLKQRPSLLEARKLEERLKQ